RARWRLSGRGRLRSGVAGTRGWPGWDDSGMADDGVRPWGSYDVLAAGPRYKVKTITVAPGHRLSSPPPPRRSEHWFVVAGDGAVTLDGQVVQVQAGEAIDVPVGVAH